MDLRFPADRTCLVKRLEALFVSLVHRSELTLFTSVRDLLALTFIRLVLVYFVLFRVKVHFTTFGCIEYSAFGCIEYSAFYFWLRVRTRITVSITLVFRQVN